MKAARQLPASAGPQVLRRPPLPRGLNATDLLEGRAFAAHAGARWNDSPRKKEIGRQTTVLLPPSPETVTWLRRMGVEPRDPADKRITSRVWARFRDPRRPNPRHPERIDDFVLGLLAICILEEGADAAFVRREGIAKYLDVPEHLVSQSFERLNKRGFLGPEKNTPPPESHRSKAHDGRDSAWQGSMREPRMDVLAEFFETVRIE